MEEPICKSVIKQKNSSEVPSRRKRCRKMIKSVQIKEEIPDLEVTVTDNPEKCLVKASIPYDKVKFEPNQNPNNISSKPLSYGNCDEGFKSSDALKKHHNPCSKKSFQCTTCEKSFTHKCSLVRHELTHNKHKPYQCKICKAEFTQSVSLKRHIQIQHNKIKPFACEICGQTFSEKTDFKVHMFNHNGEKPYSCLVCNNGFTSMRNLKRHGRVHQQGTRNVCGVCGKVFSTILKLGMHFLIHTDERPYRCELCDRGFTYSSHLKRHMLCHKKK